MIKEAEQSMSKADQNPIRCGTDLVSTLRIRQAIERRGRLMLDRLFTTGEMADCNVLEHLNDPAIPSLAARFAAKEAVAKALGCGIWRHGVSWTDIEVQRLPTGQPVIRLHGAALAYYRALNGQSIAISLSHEQDHALAFCVICCQSGDQA